MNVCCFPERAVVTSTSQIWHRYINGFDTSRLSLLLNLLLWGRYFPSFLYNGKTIWFTCIIFPFFSLYISVCQKTTKAAATTKCHMKILLSTSSLSFRTVPSLSSERAVSSCFEFLRCLFSQLISGNISQKKILIFQTAKRKCYLAA